MQLMEHSLKPQVIMQLMEHSLKPQVKRLYVWNWGLYFRQKFSEEDFLNQYVGNEPWHCKDEHTFFIKFAPHLWKCFDFYYDGHTVKSYAFLGIEVGKFYSYDSRPSVEWTAEEVFNWKRAKF